MLFLPRKDFSFGSVLLKKKKTMKQTGGIEAQRLWRQGQTAALLIWKVLLL